MRGGGINAATRSRNSLALSRSSRRTHPFLQLMRKILSSCTPYRIGFLRIRFQLLDNAATKPHQSFLASPCLRCLPFETLSCVLCAYRAVERICSKVRRLPSLILMPCNLLLCVGSYFPNHLKKQALHFLFVLQPLIVPTLHHRTFNHPYQLVNLLSRSSDTSVCL